MAKLRSEKRDVGRGTGFRDKILVLKKSREAEPQAWKPGLLIGDQVSGLHLSARNQALDRF